MAKKQVKQVQVKKVLQKTQTVRVTRSKAPQKANQSKPQIKSVKNKVIQKTAVVKRAQRVVAKPIRKAKTDQKKIQVSQAEAQVKAVKTKVIKKKQEPKKRVIKVVNQEVLERKIQKQQLLAERKRIREEKLKLKKEKLRIFEIIPNPELPLIQENPILNAGSGQNQKQQLKQAKNQKRTYDMKGCCVFCNNREIIQCVYHNDIDGLKHCFKNLSDISNPYQFYSLNHKENILHAAVKTNNIEAIKVILQYDSDNQKKTFNRVKLPSVNLEKIGTGQANKFQFYFPIRKVQLSRGGKEGNNAFTHDQSLRTMMELDLNQVLKMNPSLNLIKLLKTHNFLSNGYDVQQVFGKIVRTGNFDLVKHFYQIAENNHGFGFNLMHKGALAQGKEVEQIKGIQKSKLEKKSYESMQLTPQHLAAINPDPQVFKLYYKHNPTTNVLDAEQRDLVHYAAANYNSDILEFLISKKVEVNNKDIKGYTPLMIACRLGRIENVKLLIEDQKKKINGLNAESEEYNALINQYTYTHQLGPYKNSPLHYAANKGYIQIVKALIEEGDAQINAKNFYSNTPLSEACEQGHLNVVQYLVEKGAAIHGSDKLGKSPLIKAIMNGHIHIVSFLLRHGVSPNFKDQSENTALHYACGYGWLNIVKYLVDAGANPNQLNEWKMHPVLLAMLKGHFGIVDYLMGLNHLDVATLQDDQGRTLISQLCMNMNEDSAKNIKFLMSKGKINANLSDIDGFSALHHLANNNLVKTALDSIKNKNQAQKVQKERYIIRKGKRIKVKSSNRRRFNRWARNEQHYEELGYFDDEKDQKEFAQRLKELEDNQIKCAEILLQNGVSVANQTKQGNMTPLFMACLNNNHKLAEWLIKKDPKQISGQIDSEGLNILHLLAQNFYSSEKTLLNLLLNGDKNELKNLAKQYNHEGYTPYQLYFSEIEQMNENLSINSMHERKKTFMKNQIYPRVLKHLLDVTKIYSTDLGYDISSYIGMAKGLREKLDDLTKNGLITKPICQQILDFEYEEPEEKKEKDKKVDSLRKFKNNKERMGLFILKEQSIARSNRRAQYRQRSEDNDYEDNFKIKIDDFYGVGDTKQTVLHLLLKFIQNVKSQCDEQKFLSLISEMISSSKRFQNRDLISSAQGFNKFDHSNQNVLMLSIKYELPSITLELINQNLNLNTQSPIQLVSFIHSLSLIKNKETLDKVFNIKQKLEVNIRDKNGNIPLHYAASKRNEYLIQKLIQIGSDINSQNKFGFTPIHMSLFNYKEYKDHTPKIERILLNAGADLNITDQYNRTPLLLLFMRDYPSFKGSTQSDPANMTLQLIQSGRIKNINHRDQFDNSVLHFACSMGATISALTLINNGAEIQAKNCINNTPFTEALSHGKGDLCIFLIQNGCDVETRYQEIKSTIKENSLIANCRKTLLPKDIHEKYVKSIKFDKSLENFKKYEEQQIAKLKPISPFYLALQNNLNGIGQLLLTKEFDPFQVLEDCLKSQKFEKFADFLENSLPEELAKKIVHKKNAKGQNLLVILVANLTDEQSYERGLEIFKILMNDYKIEVTEQDSKGFNILHHASNSLELFEKIYDLLPPQKQKILMKQKSLEVKAGPVVLLKYKNKDDELDFKILSKFNLKELDLTFIDLQENFDKVDIVNEDYLFEASIFPYKNHQKESLSHLTFELLRQIDDESLGRKEKCEAILGLAKKGIDFSVTENDQSVLTYALLWGKDEIFLTCLGLVANDEGDFKPKGKPLLDVNFQDKEGKTALHWAIKPSDYGSSLGYEYIELLLKAKADPLIKDKQGLNAFDYAYNNKLVYELLQHYCKNGKPNKNKQQSVFEASQLQPINFNQGEDLLYHFNYEDDSEKYIQQMIKKKEESQMQIDDKKDDDEYKLVPDEEGKFESCEVFLDTQTNRHYDATMTKIDIKKGFYGVCNFYIIQLLFDSVKQIYILWTRWGRIGDTGQFQRTPFQLKEDAEKEFKKVYKQKTGAVWDEFDQYVPVPHKYIVKRIGGKVIYHRKKEQKWKYSLRQFNEKDWILDFKNFLLVDSKISQEQKEFILPMVQQAVILRKARNNKVKKDFFLKVLFDSDLIKDKKQILDELSKVCQQKDKAIQDRDHNEFSRLEERLFDLTNEYYEISDPTTFSQKSVRILNSRYHIEQEQSKVQLLYDMEHVTKLLFGAAYRIKEINPYDYCFNSLNVKLQNLNKTDDEYKLLLRYLNQSFWNSSQSADGKIVSNVFKIEPKNSKKNEASDKVFNSIHNHYMLFHGTSNANVLSILEQGLQIQPTNSQDLNGSAFGKGIYLADQATLSMNMVEWKKEIIGDGYHSLRVMGEKGPDFNHSVVRPDGTIWPIGDIKEYQPPIYKYNNQKFETLKELEKSKQPKKKPAKKKAPKKKAAKAKPKKIMIDTSTKSKKKEDSDDEEMEESENENNSDNEEDESEDDNGEDKNKESFYVVNQDPKLRQYKFEPEVVTYQHFHNNWARQNQNCYNLNEAQYVLFSSDQVRVRYIIQISKLKKKEEESDNEDENEEEDEEMEDY